MKIVFSCFLILFATALVSAQDLTLNWNGETIQGRPDPGGSGWEFVHDGKPYLLVEKDFFAEILEKAMNLQNDLERAEKLIAIKDSLLDAYAAFETKADEHIETQKALVNTADSLYVGYKDLYQDLKKMLGLSSTFAITFGGGFVNPPATGWRPVLSAGLGTNRWQGHFQLGDDYIGVLVNTRLSLGF